MTTRFPTQCRACRHYRGDGTCDAFPSEIPADIIRLGKDHRSPVDGDNGVRFLQKDGEQAERDFSNWRRTFLLGSRR